MYASKCMSDVYVDSKCAGIPGSLGAGKGASSCTSTSIVGLVGTRRIHVSSCWWR